MTNIQSYRQIDEMLIKALKSIGTRRYIEPLNADEQKEAFLAGETQNPVFIHRVLEDDHSAIIKRIRNVELPNDEIAPYYRRKFEELLLRQQLIESIAGKTIDGPIDDVRRITATIYGTPDEELVRYAEKLLKETPPVSDPKVVSATDMKEAYEQFLSLNGLAGWRVELSDKKRSSVSPVKRLVKVGDKTYTLNDKKRLSNHEGDHAFRAEMGHRQPLKIFINFPGYQETDEGLAVYAEETTNHMDAMSIRSRAGNAIAVDSVCRGLSFKDAFERLKVHGFTGEQVWDRLLRAYKAGGYIRDHIYLSGLLKVRKFVQEGGDLKELYVGKIRIEELPLIRKLVQDGIIQVAELPKYL